jgi:CheY-like chemotaxis protein
MRPSPAPASSPWAEDRQRTADAGFDDHLTKPADPVRIQQILEEVAVRVHR